LVLVRRKYHKGEEMKIQTHVVVQALLMVISIGTAVSGQVPAKLQPWIIGVVSLAQGIIAWVNHYYTPTGAVIPSTKP
jgi:hypothetical protein